MKIRADFVTNSSSSSFIFINFDEKKFKEAMKEKMYIAPKERWQEFENEMIEHEMEFINAFEFEDYSRGELEEVFSWYEEELLSDILGIKNEEEYDLPYFEREKAWEQDFKQALNGSLSEEQIKKLNVYWILQRRYAKRYDEEGWSKKEKAFSMEEYDNMICEYFAEGWAFYGSTEDYLYEFFLGKYTSDAEVMRSYTEELVGFKESDMLKYIFGAKKLFFWDSEVGTVAATKVLKELGYCKFACGHMG